MMCDEERLLFVCKRVQSSYSPLLGKRLSPLIPILQIYLLGSFWGGDGERWVGESILAAGILCLPPLLSISTYVLYTHGCILDQHYVAAYDADATLHKDK